MIASDPHLGWYIIGAGIGLAVLAVIAGAIRVALVALKLKKRLAAYGDLPVFDVADATAERLERASANFETVPDLLERAQASIADLQAARARIVASVSQVYGFFSPR